MSDLAREARRLCEAVLAGGRDATDAKDRLRRRAVDYVEALLEERTALLAAADRYLLAPQDDDARRALEAVLDEATARPRPALAAVAVPYRTTAEPDADRVAAWRHEACLALRQGGLPWRRLLLRGEEETDATWRTRTRDAAAGLAPSDVARLYDRERVCRWDSRDGGRP
ncbi:MAG: hypothetical protein JWM10_2745 [Myxococcaceae bacterium]|nr:hypothetical protein [Myxococcaceae bacterium]